MSALFLRGLRRQLPRVMASTHSLYARQEVSAGLPRLSGIGRSCPTYALHILAGGGHPGLNTGLKMVRAGRSFIAQLQINRQCNTTSDKDQDYAKLVRKLGDDIEDHKFKIMVCLIIFALFFGTILDATRDLTMKINKTDMENSIMSVKLVEQKAKTDALAEEVKFLSALLATSSSVTEVSTAANADQIKKNEASTPTTNASPATCNPATGATSVAC